MCSETHIVSIKTHTHTHMGYVCVCGLTCAVFVTSSLCRSGELAPLHCTSSCGTQEGSLGREGSAREGKVGRERERGLRGRLWRNKGVELGAETSWMEWLNGGPTESGVAVVCRVSDEGVKELSLEDSLAERKR